MRVASVCAELHSRHNESSAGVEILEYYRSTRVVEVVYGFRSSEHLGVVRGFVDGTLF